MQQPADSLPLPGFGRLLRQPSSSAVWQSGFFLAVRTVFFVLTLAVLSFAATIFLRTNWGFAETAGVLSQLHKSRAINIVLIKYRMISSYLSYHLLVDLG